jgi:hypothetical protein
LEREPRKYHCFCIFKKSGTQVSKQIL